MEHSIVKAIREKGVVGAGGAAFPTYVKLNAKAKYIIVNCAECEPLLRVDQQLLVYETEKIFKGAEKVKNQIGAEKVYFALKKKYKKAVETAEKEMKKFQNIEIFLLDDFYPAGDEQITVYEVLKKIVPEGGIPLQVETVVLNPETLLNIHNAIQGIALTEKYVTITGEVNNPKTLKVPIGTAVKELIQLAGGSQLEDYAIIDGGPMMGKLIDKDNSFVKKNTKGIIVLPQNHPLVISKKQSISVSLKNGKIACCQCSLCTELCPRNLLGHKISPDKIMRLTAYQSTCDIKQDATTAFLCSECGLCEQVCIMNLQPWKINKELKKQLSEAGIKNPHHEQPEKAADFREYKKFPVKRLIQRLGIDKYNQDAPLGENTDIKEVTISLSQHIGQIAKSVVAENEQVEKGQIIGIVEENQLGSYIHASIKGKVVSVTNNEITIKA